MRVWRVISEEEQEWDDAAGRRRAGRNNTRTATQVPFKQDRKVRKKQGRWNMVKRDGGVLAQKLAGPDRRKRHWEQERKGGE